jgi:CheY-like chemotaxis protein
MAIESNGRSVLVIEDDAEVRRFAVRVLELEGYTAASSGDGVEGLRIARRGDIDLVLLDLRLPGATGWEVLEEMRDDPQLAAIPVLLFTAAASVEVQERIASSGAAGYLTKPLTSRDLKEKVAATLLQAG